MAFIQHITGPHMRDLGSFSVKRALPSAARQTAGPFIFFDHMGPVNFAPGKGTDVCPHLHIELTTVAYLFGGSMARQDSLGSVQTIAPGGVSQMTAGNGIVHSKRSSPEGREKGTRMHGVQTWVALPKDQKEVNTSFAHHAAETLLRLECPDIQGMIIAGDMFELVSSVKVSSRTLYVALELAVGASLVIPSEHADCGLYLTDGTITIDGGALSSQHLAILEPGGGVTLTVQASSHTTLLGGVPTGGHRHTYWNSAASDKANTENARQRWENDAPAHMPGETERIPLPSK